MGRRLRSSRDPPRRAHGQGGQQAGSEVKECQEAAGEYRELDYALYMAERRVLEIQAKLHRWAGDDPHRRFDDLYNLVTDPAFLLIAWTRVRGNKGARTAGVDGETATTSRPCAGWKGSWRDCGRILRTVPSARCRSGSG